jgi:pyrroline-5-carboxylate reductase
MVGALGARIVAGACAALLVANAPAFAESRYPDRPLRIIVPSTPAGVLDNVARALSVGLAGQLGQSIVIDNKPGAGGNIGAEAVAKAEGSGEEQVFVSVAAGVSTAFYEAKLPAGAPVVRVMPNAPMVVGGGVSALAPGRFATAEQLKEVSAIFDTVGDVLTVAESQMHAVTAVSGSGPAYFFLLVEALVDAGVEAGLSREVATELVVHTMAGSAAMLLDRRDSTPAGSIDTSAAALRAVVTSPGGTTAAGLRELERGGLRSAVADAVSAANRRSEQLGITLE